MNLRTIPGNTLLLTVVGDKDNLASDIDAKRIFNETPQIPRSNKDFVLVISDDHGSPALTANHFAPCALDKRYDSGERLGRRKIEGFFRSGNTDFFDVKIGEKLGALNVNALDYYGFWKLFDGLCDAAFYGKNREYALGNTAQQRFMDKWSDGIPVKGLVVTEHP